MARARARRKARAPRQSRHKGVHIGFKNLERKFRAQGKRNPAGLARSIGIKKYGKAGFAAKQAHGRKVAAMRRKQARAHAARVRRKRG